MKSLMGFFRVFGLNNNLLNNSNNIYGNSASILNVFNVKRLASKVTASPSATTATTTIDSNNNENQNTNKKVKKLSPLETNTKLFAFTTSKDTFTSSSAFDRLIDRTRKAENQKYPVVGQSWTAEQLRLKSDDDLEKLWWVLSLERNELLTEEYAAKKHGGKLLNPSRLTKVAISMSRIKTVLGEREREAIPGLKEGTARLKEPKSSN